MELKNSDVYEALAIEWQYQMILVLKEKLLKAGVDDDMAKEIVGEFVFDFALLHDQAAIVVNGKSYNPRISFDDFEGNLISTDEVSNLHEYAFASTGEAYGE
ncbi:MAG: Uncharacterized protein FD165_2683 [Gammaproteobacteria bacterium]|nr:MAG: Uncharacterized protein FD165_2683 [Gammaproteobacteria bacterium]TND01767.1 MAG: Uncharacterized protein FD120_2531 [Gammaproteobacteria bacterium]